MVNDVEATEPPAEVDQISDLTVAPLAKARRAQVEPLSVMELAQRLEIHPAIVAGRVRHETKNFRLLSQFVGTGEVRRQLLEGQPA